MKKNLALLMCILSFGNITAQTKLTDFAGQKTSAPLNVRKIGVLDERLIFTATVKEKKGVWSTDGTPEETRFLGDNNDLDFYYCDESPLKAVKDGFLYVTNCQKNKLIRTDGKIIEVIYDSRDGLVSELRLFKGELHAVIDFRRGTGNLLLKLSGTEKVETLKSDFGSFQFAGQGFFYEVQNADIRFHAIYYFDGINTAKIKEIGGGQNGFSPDLKAYSKGKDAILIYNSGFSGKELLIYDFQQNKILFTEPDWGRQTAFKESYVVGQNGDEYVVKNNVNISGNTRQDFFDLKKRTSDTSLTLLSSVPLSSIAPTNSVNSGSGYVSQLHYATDSTIFYSITGIGGVGNILQHVVCRYNFKTDLLVRSEDLQQQLFVKYFSIPEFKNIVGDKVTYADGKGNLIIYDFDKKAVSDFVSNPEIESDSVAVVNGEKLLITNNVYRTNGTGNTPLIEPIDVFANDSQQYLIRKELNDKMLLVSLQYSGTVPGFEAATLDAENKIEKILKVADEFFIGRFNNHATEFNGKAYFITKAGTAENEVSEHYIYTTGGTAATTSKIGTFMSPSFGIRQTFTNERQLVYLADELVGRKPVLIKVEDGKIIKTPLPVNFGEIIQTAKDTFYATKVNALGQIGKIYVLKDEKLEIIAENTGNYAASEQSLFYAKSQLGTFIPSGVFVYENGKERMIAPKSYTNVRVLDNRVLLSNETGNRFVVFDSSDGKELFRFDQPAAERIDVQLVDGAIIFVQSQQVTVFKGSSEKTIALKKPFGFSSVRPVQNGFLILSNTQNNVSEITDAGYYNLRTDELKSIETPIALQSVQSTFDANKPNYLIFTASEGNNNGNRSLWFWDESLAEIKRFDTDEVASNFVRSSGRVVIENVSLSQGYDQRIWYHSPGLFSPVASIAYNDGLVQFYERPDHAPIVYSVVSSSSSASFSGNTFTQFTENKTIEFPNINEGKGGALVSYYFPFKDQLYAYAFTYNDGWQVWNLGEFAEENYIADIALGNEETSIEVNVYPNPTIDEITISAAEPITVELLDVSGRSMLKYDAKNTTHYFSVEKFKTGTYLLLIKNGEGSAVVKKVVKR